MPCMHVFSNLWREICHRWTTLLSVVGLFAQGGVEYYSHYHGDNVILRGIGLIGCLVIFVVSLFDMWKTYMRARKLGAEWISCRMFPFFYLRIQYGICFFPPQVIGVASSFAALYLSVASLFDVIHGFKKTYYFPFTLVCASLTLLSAFNDYERMEKELLSRALKKSISDMDYACYEVAAVMADVEDLVEYSKLF